MSQNIHKYGLIGFPLTHSFSKKYFSEKFEKEGLCHFNYSLFQLENISELPNLLASERNLRGLNVTIPYKQSVLSFLDQINGDAQTIGAVNVIKIKDGKLIGYNSDAYGFEGSLTGLLKKRHTQKTDIQALILGTGGASLAVRFVLEKMGIPYTYVSRKDGKGQLTYKEVGSEVMNAHRLVINCTPLGTYPNTENYPDLPYGAVTPDHFFYDLVYNPPESVFLKKAKANGAVTLNGLAMLHLQAERSWEIWGEDGIGN